MKLLIGGQVFPSKALAKKYVIGIAERYVNSEINVKSPDYGLFQDLWTRSPSFEDGYDRFHVGRKFSGVCICSISSDGNNKIDWSLRNAVAGRFPTTWTQCVLSMRHAIRPQIQVFREQCNKCKLCDSKENIEIDHVVSFNSLMLGYLGPTVNMPDIYKYTSSGWTFTPENAEFEKGWVEYHRQNCELRPLCSTCHKQVTRASREPEETP